MRTKDNKSDWAINWMKNNFSILPPRVDEHPHKMVDAVISEIKGRKIRVGQQWLIDFASCNYLGLDLDPEIHTQLLPHVTAWGTHPSWSRLLGSPNIYIEIEQSLKKLLDAPDILTFPTITHIHMTVLPFLAGQGNIYLDSRAHKTIYDGCKIAEGRGAKIIRFQHNDIENIENLIAAGKGVPRIICLDGVNSMTGNLPDLAAFAELAKRYGALLYIDDAHGFGVLGESPDESMPWGYRGNSIVRHVNCDYENIVFIAGLSKAYSSLLAFLAIPTSLKEVLKIASPPYLYSGPSPTATLASTLIGLKINEQRGDEIRKRLYSLCLKLFAGLKALDIFTFNQTTLPIAEIPLDDPTKIDELGDFLFMRGIYVTLARYPLVPKNEVGIRVQLTAANTEQEVDDLLTVLAEAKNKFHFKHYEK